MLEHDNISLSMAKNKETADRILSLTGGFTMSAIDLVILMVAFAGSWYAAGMSARPGQKRILERPFEWTGWVYRGWDRSKLRAALSRALGKNFLERIGDRYRLTKAGVRHLRDILPSYKRRGSWDGRLWVVTYDITTKRNTTRDRFRTFLTEIGCGMVQDSVWLSVKDPRPWLIQKISDLHLKGSVIISCLGKDGSLGDENVKELVTRIFRLRHFNRRYGRWIRKVKRLGQKVSVVNGFEFLAIVRDDPMIPTELLPSTWKGHRAQEMFERKIFTLMGDAKTYF